MFDDEYKKQLVENSSGATLVGHPCTIGGWQNPFATITADFRGFYAAYWWDVKRVLDGDRNFTAEDVWFSGSGWRGAGVEVPPELGG